MALRGVAVAALMAAALTAFLPQAASARATGTAGQPAPTALASSESSAPTGGSGLESGAGQWPLKSLDAAALWRRTRGAGVRIAVVDTGVNADGPDLKNVAIESRDLLGGPAAAVSSRFHGTSVAERIAGNGLTGPAGLAPAATVIDIRVAARLSAVTAGAVAAGIKAAVTANAQVINVSVEVRPDTPALLAAVLAAERDGRLVVASAGGSTAALYPAAIAGVLSVGAEDQNGDLAAAPPGTRLFAPGVRVFPKAGAPGASALNGSDLAAAYVSAAAALLLSASPTLTPRVAGGTLSAAAGPSKVLNPGRALKLVPVTPATPTSSPGKPSSAPSPSRGGSPLLTYVVVVLAVLVVLFAAFIGLTLRRNRRTAISVSGSGTAASPPPGDDRVLQSQGHEPFSWDQSW